MGHARYSRPQLARGEGRQWKTVKKDGNVHFIEKVDSKKSASMPMHTHSKTKVYASVENGKLKSISVMNPKTGKKVMEFHLSHKHNGHIFTAREQSGSFGNAKACASFPRPLGQNRKASNTASTDCRAAQLSP